MWWSVYFYYPNLNLFYQVLLTDPQNTQRFELTDVTGNYARELALVRLTKRICSNARNSVRQDVRSLE